MYQIYESAKPLIVFYGDTWEQPKKPKVAKSCGKIRLVIDLTCKACSMVLVAKRKKIFSSLSKKYNI